MLANNEIITAPLNLVVVNSIIWGDFNEEIILSNEGGESFSKWINYNILKTEITELDSGRNQVNIDPLFVAPENYDFHLDSLSTAIDAGLPRGLLTDLEGMPRDSLPDLGAFERIE